MSTADILPVLTHGQGSQVHSADGRTWTDLVTGFGAAFLGHGHPAVTAALQAQAAGLWACGRFPLARQAAVDSLLQQVLPLGLRPAGLLSTGMEATEYAMRLAAIHTGRQEFAAFGRSMHGKSAMSAALCWSNAPLRPQGLHTLPFVDTSDEAQVLNSLRESLRTQRIAALFIEPIQGSNGAHEASLAFYEQALALCHEHGSLCVFDEILTGLYRTGPAFYCQALSVLPDMLVFAKSMGNGFPVSAVALGAHVQATPQALPGSTFAGNPLALAVVEATLTEMAKQPMAQQVATLQDIAREHFGALSTQGVLLRGRGALWCLELGPQIDLPHLTEAVRQAGLLVTLNGRFMRLLPAATMSPTAWRGACQQMAAACQAARR